MRGCVKITTLLNSLYIKNIADMYVWNKYLKWQKRWI